MTSFFRPLAVAALATVGASLGLAGPSRAAISLDRACYVDAGMDGRQPITVTASGLQPGVAYNAGFVSPEAKETGYAYAVAGPTGDATMTFSTWWSGSSYDMKTYRSSVVLRQTGDPTVLEQVEVRTTSLGVSERGSGRLRRWKVIGLAALTERQTYWAHYFRGSKRIGSMKLGRAKGPCGVYTGRRPLMPSALASKRPNKVQILTTQRWSKSQPRLSAKIVTKRRR